MAEFIYKVGNSRGDVTKGEIEAIDISQAAEKLKGQGLSILKLDEKKSLSLNSLESLTNRIKGLFGAELTAMERVMFTTNFAEMLKTGLPIVEAVSTFEDQGGSSRAKEMFRQIVADIRNGKPPSAAFAKFPASFPPIYTHIMSSGETTGTLGETMSYLALQLKKDFELTGRVKGALTYPAVVMIVMVVVMVFITFSVVPKITSFASSLNQELPLSTRILVEGNKFLAKNIHLILVGIASSIFGFGRVSKTDKGRKFIDKIILSLPVFGTLVRRFDLSRFCRLLSAFYKYGISLPRAFEILSVSLTNSYYKSAALSIKENVARGISLSESLDHEDKTLFPKIMVKVIRGAEKSAGVDSSLGRLADYYETELENSLKGMTTIIEPVMIVVLGVMVVSIAVAVIVPIYKVTVSFK